MPTSPIIWGDGVTGTQWFEASGTSLLGATGAKVDDILDGAEAVTKAVSASLGVVQTVLSQMKTIVSAVGKLPNALDAVVLLTDQIKDEFLGTGIKVLPMWEYPVKDYLHFLRTGKRFYHESNRQASYNDFMSDLGNSFDDLGDLDRPVTSGPVVAIVLAAAAPSFGELGAAYRKLLALVPNVAEMQGILTQIELLDGSVLTAPKTYSTPPDWAGWTIRDVWPGLATMLDQGINKLAEMLEPAANIEDAVVELLELYIIKIQELLRIVDEVVSYALNLQQILSSGFYMLYAFSTSGVSNLKQAILASKPATEWTIDMYFGGLVLLAEGSNVYSFKSLFESAVPGSTTSADGLVTATS